MNVLLEKDEGWIQPSSFQRHSIFLDPGIWKVERSAALLSLELCLPPHVTLPFPLHPPSQMHLKWLLLPSLPPLPDGPFHPYGQGCEQSQQPEHGR